MAKKVPRQRRQRRRRHNPMRKRVTQDTLIVGAATFAFGLFLAGTVNHFDKDEWVEMGAAATTITGAVAGLRKILQDS